MAPTLHFDKNPEGKKSSFLLMTQSEKEFDEVVKENDSFCQMVIKGLLSVVNEETTITEEVIGILDDFKKLIVDELPKDLSLMRDKCTKVKVFNVGDDVMVFVRKKKFLVDTCNMLQSGKYDPFKVTRKINDNAYMVTLLDSMNISNNFNITEFHEYQTYEAFYQEENSGLSSSEVDETDVRRLVTCIEEVMRQKGSTRIVQA